MPQYLWSPADDPTAPDLSGNNVLGGTSLRLGVGTLTQIRTCSLVLKRLQQLARPRPARAMASLEDGVQIGHPEGRARGKGGRGKDRPGTLWKQFHEVPRES